MKKERETMIEAINMIKSKNKQQGRYWVSKINDLKKHESKTKQM